MDQKELRELESQCIQEHAPPCTAACPLHVDVRGVLTVLADENFDAALQILVKRLPFPGIIGRICEQPCRGVCNRKDAGEAVEIAALERACATFGALASPARRIPPRGKRVAVIGGGLNGIMTALQLTRKAHSVTLFEATERLGGALWFTPEDLLPREVLVAELESALRDVDVRLQYPVAAIDLTTLCTEYDAVYLGVGRSATGDFDALLGEVDPVTLATPEAGVFAGGRAIEDTPSFIGSLGSGHRAAISIDRYLQKASLTASRENEGVYTTRLFTNLEGVMPAPAVIPANPALGYTRTEAVAEARRCIQCECMECVKVCSYLQHFGSYPKQYLRQIYNNLSIVMGERHFNILINSCNLCGLCGEVCPEGLNMAPVCRDARQLMVTQKRMPPSAHDFALRDMAFSNSPPAALARRAPGAARSDFVFFPGCQLDASAPEHVMQVYDYLRKALPNVGLLLRCCGAPADWAGRRDLFEESIAGFRADYAALGGGTVILACSTCYQMFKTHFPDVPVVSLWEVFDAHGLPEHSSLPAPLALAIHDPCTTRYERGVQDSARSVLHTLGCKIEELPLNRERTECCSYGGLMWLANRTLAETAVQRRIAEHSADYVTYCAMCRDFFADQGKPTLHVLDLLYERDLPARATRPGPRFSQRHDNRAWLKRSLLANIWEETMGEAQVATTPLHFSEVVATRIDRRLILEEDIRKVMGYVESTGNCFRNPDNGHFLAYYKPANVTYWVEYSPAEDGYTIHNAYSHRMEIVMQPKAQEVSE